MMTNKQTHRHTRILLYIYEPLCGLRTLCDRLRHPPASYLNSIMLIYDVYGTIDSTTKKNKKIIGF